jgi:hypothetical protein
MKKGLVIQLLILGVVLFATNVMAGGNGSSPNGKPFIEIAGQFVEVQNNVFDLEQAVADLTGRVESNEERIDVNEAAIANLNAENDLIGQQMGDLVQQAAVNSAEVNNVLIRIETISTELGYLRASVSTNAGQISNLETELGELSNYLATNVAGLLTLKSQVEDNMDVIFALQEQIDEVNEEIENNRIFLDASCDDGAVLSAVDSDGSFSCTTVASSTPQFGLRSTTVNGSVSVPPAVDEIVHSQNCYINIPGGPTICTPVSWSTRVFGTAVVIKACPDNQAYTDSGYKTVQNGIDITRIYQRNQGVQLYLRNTAIYPRTAHYFYTCTEIFEVTP